MIDAEDVVLSRSELIDGRAADRAEAENDGVELIHGVSISIVHSLSVKGVTEFADSAPVSVFNAPSPTRGRS